MTTKWIYGVISKSDKVVGFLSDALADIATIGTIGITVLIGAYILMRDAIVPLFPGLKVWRFVEEWGVFINVLIAYLGMAYALRVGAHLKSDFVTKRMRPRAAAALEAFTTFLALGMSVYLMVVSFDWWWGYLVADNVRSMTTRVPLMIPYLFLLVGMAVFILALAMHIVHKVMEARGGTGGDAKGDGQ